MRPDTFTTSTHFGWELASRPSFTLVLGTAPPTPLLPAHTSIGVGARVWNNTGDKVILRRADGSLKDTCSYPGEGAFKYYC
jgi:hypothetical protein